MTAADDAVRSQADLVVRATMTLGSLNALIAKVQQMDAATQPRKAAEVVAASDRLLAGIDDMIRRINQALDTMHDSEGGGDGDHTESVG